jgi:hypothetical protein
MKIWVSSKEKWNLRSTRKLVSDEVFDQYNFGSRRLSKMAQGLIKNLLDLDGRPRFERTAVGDGAY